MTKQEDTIKEDFERLLEINNQKKTATRTTRAVPVLPVLPEANTKERLARFNQAVAKKKRRQAFHNFMMDMVIVSSFILIVYIALTA